MGSPLGPPLTTGPKLPDVGYGAFIATHFTAVAAGGFRDEPIIVLTGTADVIMPTYAQAYLVNKAGVDAMTLAAPIAGSIINGVVVGGDDGKRIRIFSNTANAHTITTPANKIANGHHLITFGGAVGDYIELEAIQGVWFPLGSSGATIT